jgi:hypothetical protein
MNKPTAPISALLLGTTSIASKLLSAGKAYQV